MKLADALAGRDLANRITVPILLSTEAADDLSRAESRVEAAETVVRRAEAAEAELLNKPHTEEAKRALETARERLAAAQKAARQHLQEFELRSVGSTLWDRLITANRPTEEQVKLYGKRLWNRETFPLVAVAFSLVEPCVEPDQLDTYLKWLDTLTGDPPIPPDVIDLKSRVPDVVWQQIWGAALRVNAGANQVPLSLTGSEQTRSSETESAPQ